MNDSTWTWMSGNNTALNVKGVYGQQNVTETTNYPGGRLVSSGWYDSTNQEFWVFGGYEHNGEYFIWLMKQ